MPGIAGIIYKAPNGAGPRDRVAVEQMVNSMRHETWYTAGTHSEESLGLVVGWTCFNDTTHNSLPAWNETRDIALFFTGEEYAHDEKVIALRARGHAIGSDLSSYLLHAYEEDGISFLEPLDGWFSGVLVDLRERKIIVFNDRFGINRLYYHEDNEAFYFASEAKALLRVLPALRRLDMVSLGEFFSCGCVLQGRTLYSGISLIPGASAWVFQPSRPPERGSYFEKGQWEQQAPLTPEEYYERFRAVWSKILPRYFEAPQQIALSLTGGLDSRLILAHAPKAPGTLPCYTFGGPYRDCADVTISRRAAKLCQQSHETIPISQDYFREFPSLVERTTYLTDGTLDATGTADLFVQRRAREIAPVRITGLNGGELLRGSIMFKPASLQSSLMNPDFAHYVSLASATYTQERNCHDLSFILFKQAPWHLHARLALERSQLTVRTPYFANELAALAYQAPTQVMNASPALRLIVEGAPQLRALGTDRAKLVDARGVFTRVEQAIQNFTFKAEYAYDYGMPQWLAKTDHLLAPLRLERLFLGRHKFYHFRVWFRDCFADYIQDTLLSKRALSRPYLNAVSLQRMVTAHVKGIANYTSEINRVLAAELIHQQLLESQ